MFLNDYLSSNCISKYQFAKICQLPYATLNDICNGKTDLMKCTGETLLKIANALNCTVDFLLNEELNCAVFNLQKIKKLVEPVAKKYQLHAVYIFGSYARNEANEKSDIDLLVDRENSTIHSIFDMNALSNDFKQVLNKEVDLVTIQSLRQKSTLSNNYEFVENVLNDKVQIYG